MRNYTTRLPGASATANSVDKRLSSRDHGVLRAQAECRAAVDAYEEWLTTDGPISDEGELDLAADPRCGTSRRTLPLVTRRHAETFGIEDLPVQLPLDQDLDTGDLP